MSNKELPIKIIQIGDKKTVEGIPKDIAIRFGGLEMTVHIDGLTSWDDGKPSDEQRQYLIKNLEDGDELIKLLQRIINRTIQRTD